MVRQIRLLALADAPGAFGSTLARELGFDDEEWMRRVGEGSWFLAELDRRPVGVVATILEPDAPSEPHLVAMWVEPAERGTPVGARLVESACRSAQSTGARAITLCVADDNPRARRFYERLGFEPTGLRQPMQSNLEVGSERMRRPLPAAAE